MALPNACPLCNARPDRLAVVTSHVFGGDDGHAIFRCEDCDLTFLHPGLSPDDEQRFYAREFENFMANRSADDAGWEKPERHIRANESQRLRRTGHLTGLIDGRKRILEVGCSSGFMLYPLLELGHECVGVEPSGVFSEFVRSRGVECYDSVDALVDAHGSSGFDLILHYYVMEHVANPIHFLKSQFELLRPGGALLFEVPHAKDALAALYDIAAYERFIWVISHRWYFTKRSLNLLLKKACGAGEVRFDQRYDLSNHLVWARDGRPGGLGRFTATLGDEIENQYKSALIKAGYGDTLIGIVRK